MAYDPFASDEVDSMDNTAGATSEFLKAADFEGRLVFIRPFNLLEGLKSNLNDTTYDAIEADVHVLDGAPSDKIGAVPSVQQSVRLNGGALVPQLKTALRGGGWVLGRMVSFKGKGNQPGYKLDEPTQADWELRNHYVAAVKAQRAGAAQASQAPAQPAAASTPAVAAAAKPATPAKAGGNPFLK